MESRCSILQFVIGIVSQGSVPIIKPKLMHSINMKCSFFLGSLSFYYQKNLIEAHSCAKNYFCSLISDKILRLENFITSVMLVL